MEAAGALGVAAPILESIPNPPGGVGWSWVGCGCHKVPISDQIPILLSFLCGVRIELAVGSLPYLALALYLSRSLTIPHSV